MSKHEKSPAEFLVDAVSDLATICDELLAKWNKENEAGNASGALKILTEYRHFLKLRLDVLKNLGGLIEEARFQQALLLALKGVSEDVHGKVVDALYSLQDEWSDQTPDPDDTDDAEETGDDDDDDTPEAPREPDSDVNPVRAFPHGDEDPDYRKDKESDNPEEGDVAEEDD